MIFPFKKTGFTSLSHQFSFHGEKKITLMQPHRKPEAHVIHILCKTSDRARQRVWRDAFPCIPNFQSVALRLVFFFAPALLVVMISGSEQVYNCAPLVLLRCFILTLFFHPGGF